MSHESRNGEGPSEHDDLDLIRAVLEGFQPCMARSSGLNAVYRLLAKSSARSETGRTIPEGWKLVPEQATEAMRMAGATQFGGCRFDSPEGRAAAKAWKKMYDAAPLAPNHEPAKGA